MALFLQGHSTRPDGTRDSFWTTETHLKRENGQLMAYLDDWYPVKVSLSGTIAYIVVDGTPITVKPSSVPPRDLADYLVRLSCFAKTDNMAGLLQAVEDSPEFVHELADLIRLVEESIGAPLGHALPGIYQRPFDQALGLMLVEASLGLLTSSPASDRLTANNQ